MSQRKLKSNIKIQPVIPNLNSHDKWAKMIPGCIEHIMNQDIQGITLLNPWVSPDTDMKFDEGKQSKLEAITDRINACIDYFYDKTDATHIWIVDVDTEVPKHALRYLLELDVDVASGIYPFHNEKYAMMFGRMHDPNAPAKDVEKTNMFSPHGLIGLPEDGVTGSEGRVGGGNGCLLVKRRVFQEWHPNIKPIRFINNVERLGSDLYFWYRCQNAGFTCRIHWHVLCGHRPQWSLSCYKEDYKTKFGMELEE